jgi:aerobic-type carbon monoxide dehydrogenase small subunit (CoxS/CutS family)
VTDDDVQLIRLIVNGAEHEFATSCRRSLADVLRHELGLTGTHVGCEHGVCGACTVLVDGEPVRACLMLGVQADDRSVLTVEGLGDDEHGARLQRAFSEERAYQCGFCTPGFLLVGRWLLEHEPDADAQRVREVVSSNLCRCTGYEPIVAAIRAAQDGA